MLQKVLPLITHPIWLGDFNLLQGILVSQNVLSTHEIRPPLCKAFPNGGLNREVPL